MKGYEKTQKIVLELAAWKASIAKINRIAVNPHAIGYRTNAR